MKKPGFTLAEVLITLVIIGVIAAMTVPTLMQNTNSQEYRSALKKAVSALNQALTLHYALEGLTASDYSSAQDLVQNLFEQRMSTIGGDGGAQVTWPSTTTACSGTVFATNDGIIYCVDNFSSGGVSSNDQSAACNSFNTEPCGTPPNILVDVNGSRNPNRLTDSADRPRDIYQLALYSQKVVAFGEATQGVMYDRQVNDGAATPQTP